MVDYIEYVENIVSNERVEALTKHAGKSFLRSAKANGYESLSSEMLRMWIVDMAIAGFNKTTRKKYFSRLNTLYREWKSVAGKDPFAEARPYLDRDFEPSNARVEADLQRTGVLMRNASFEADNPYRDIFLYLFYNPGADIRDTAELRVDNAVPECPQIEDIVDRQCAESRRSKYVFGMDQGKKRTPQIVSETTAGIRAFLGKAGVATGETFSRSYLTALWIAAALKAKVSPAEIRALIRVVPEEYASFGLVPTVELSDRKKTEILRRVADSVCDNTPQWFVMRMRAGRNADMIKQRIEAAAPDLFSGMLFYYPTHKVWKKTPKGKHVRKEVPYLPGTLFFRLDRTKVSFLMSRIGDSAWCYKWNRFGDSGYCTISRSEMLAFQKHIGEFTSDIEMDLAVSEQPIPEGTVVKIAGGGRMEGYEGVVESVGVTNGTRTYTLRLTEFLEARWTIENIEEYFLEKAAPGDKQ